MSQAEEKLFELMGNKEYKLQLLKEKFNINEIERQIFLSEDFITTSDHDSRGELRTGVYHKSENLSNVTKTSLEQAVEWLKFDTIKAIQNCMENVKEFTKLSERRQLALILMSFNLEENFKSFAKFLNFVNEKKFPQAAVELCDSAWYFKNKVKAVKIAKLLVEEC
jgi:hypothetical protein